MYANWRQYVGDPRMPKEWPKRARIGLNGFDSTGRTLLRCALEDKRGLDIVAINEPNMTPEQMVYLIKRDTNMGPFKGHVSDKITVTEAKDGNAIYCNLQVAGRYIGVFHHKNNDEIPWHWLNVEYVLETTGELKHLDDAMKHLAGGRARKVLVVGDAADIPLLMYPITYRGYQRGTSSVASGSPMAHAVATLLSVVEESCGIEGCMATLLLPVDRWQSLVDCSTKDLRSWRKGRAALQNVIPGRCPAVVNSVLQALPSLRSRFDAITMNVPVFEGAVVDLTVRTLRPASNITDVIEKITRSSLLKQYNELHIRTQPTRHQQTCEAQQISYQVPTQPQQRQQPLQMQQYLTSSSSSVMETMARDAEHSASESSGQSCGTRPDSISAIRIPSDMTSILLPLNKEEAYVSSDIPGKHALCLLNVDCCLGIPSGCTVKLVAWFDPGISYCERILDTVVFMRGVDQN